MLDKTKKKRFFEYKCLKMFQLKSLIEQARWYYKNVKIKLCNFKRYYFTFKNRYFCNAKQVLLHDKRACFTTQKRLFYNTLIFSLLHHTVSFVNSLHF